MKDRVSEISEIAQMVRVDRMDIRAVTIGINLLDCVSENIERIKQNVYDKILPMADKLVEQADRIENEFGIPIKNRRIAVTPISLIVGNVPKEEYEEIAEVLEQVVKKVNSPPRMPEKGITFIGGYSALVHKGWTRTEEAFIESIPSALSRTEHVCSMVSVASTKAGINMTAILKIARIIKEIAEQTPNAVGCARFAVFANAPEDNPFMPGAFHGVGEPECVINVGISGPCVVKRIVDQSENVSLDLLADRIKRASFKMVRAGEMVRRELAKNIGVEPGIVDLSLAPTFDPEENSIAKILEAMGLEKCGTHGTIAALALLTDAVKKGGVMATTNVGGLSGAFVPVSEDKGMIEAVEAGALSLDKLEAMTSVCSVGLDMIGIPGDTPLETIAAIIADEMAIGVMNNKTTSVRLIPIPGGKPGQVVDFREYNDLLGLVIILDVKKQWSSRNFVNRNGRIPAPITSLTN